MRRRANNRGGARLYGSWLPAGLLWAVLAFCGADAAAGDRDVAAETARAFARLRDVIVDIERLLLDEASPPPAFGGAPIGCAAAAPVSTLPQDLARLTADAERLADVREAEPLRYCGDGLRDASRAALEEMNGLDAPTSSAAACSGAPALTSADRTRLDSLREVFQGHLDACGG